MLMILLCSLNAWAQDVIVKKDGSTVVCRVVEVTKTEVIYKKWTDLQGSGYIIDKSLVSAINYENGTKQDLDDASETTESTKPMTDSDLLKMASYEELKRNMKNPTQVEVKITRLKKVGWIGGGACMTAGIALLITGRLMYYVHCDGATDWRIAGPGIPLLIGGAALTTGCLIKAHNIKKQMQQLQYSVHSAPLYHQEFKLKNGASLATGIDFLGDNTNRHPALGIGLNYNF